MKWGDLNPLTWWRSFAAYQRTGYMQVPATSGPDGFKGFPPIQDSTLTGAELLEEAQGEDPEPAMPALTTTESKVGKQV